MEPEAIKEAREFISSESEFWEGFKECKGNHCKHFEDRVIKAQWIIRDILQWYDSQPKIKITESEWKPGCSLDTPEVE